MPGEMRSRLAGRQIDGVDLVEGVAGLALALKDETLAVGRPVPFACAPAFNRQPPDPR